MEKIKKRDLHEEDIELILEHISDFTLKGVIHIGAHNGEEVSNYKAKGINNIILVEANPNDYDFLKNKFGEKCGVFNYAIFNKNENLTFYVHQSNSGTESSSVLKMDKFDKIVTSLKTTEEFIVEGITLDNFIVKENIDLNQYNLLITDIQGADYFAIEGGQNTLKNIDVVVVEVQFIELYEKYVSIEQFDELMSKNGMYRSFVIEHELYEDNNYFPAWGEVVYKRKSR